MILMSVKRPKAEVARRWWHFRFVPLAEVTATKARIEMNIVRIEIRHIPMAVTTGYCQIRFKGYLGNVG
jgi:hypothetical protein